MVWGLGFVVYGLGVGIQCLKLDDLWGGGR